MATGTHELGDYTIEDDGNGDYVLKKPDGNIIYRWDDSAGDWYINDESGITVIQWDSSAGEIQFNSKALSEIASIDGLSTNAVSNLEGDNLTVDGSGNLDATDTRTDVSETGSTVVSDVTDINFGTDLSVTDDTDGTVTVDASIGGGGYSTVSTVTSNTTASDREIVLVDASGGAVTVTLPSPSEAQQVTVKKIDSSTNAATIATPGSETIDGQSSIDITNQYAARETTSDGTNYYII